MSKKVYADRIRGVLFGKAVGDALGLGAEFMTRSQVHAMYPAGRLKSYEDIDRSSKHRRAWELGEWTDDTAQALCIFDSLLENNGEVVPFDVAHRFMSWVEKDARGSGNTFLGAVLEPGYEHDPIGVARRKWVEGGCKAAPNGGLMRTAFVGLFFDSQTEVEVAARTFCEVTHADPRCAATCEIASVIVSEQIHGRDEDFNSNITKLIQAAVRDGRISGEDAENLLLTDNLRALNLGPEDRDGIGYTVRTLGAALWAARHAPDFYTGIQAIIYEGGDTDTNAAVAGALMGAKWRVDVIPEHLIAGLTEKQALEERAQKLFDYWEGKGYQVIGRDVSPPGLE